MYTGFGLSELVASGEHAASEGSVFCPFTNSDFKRQWSLITAQVGCTEDCSAAVGTHTFEVMTGLSITSGIGKMFFLVLESCLEVVTTAECQLLLGQYEGKNTTQLCAAELVAHSFLPRLSASKPQYVSDENGRMLCNISG